MTGLPWLDVGALPTAAAVDALEAALAAGFDPAADVPRVASGDVLLMPSVVGAYAGVKVVSVARGNAARGLPVIQGVFVLWDAQTLTPIALMDGAALTALRTPAVSALAVRRLAHPDARRLVVLGRGPQGQGHIHAMREALPVESVSVFGSDAPADAVTAAVSEADVICCCTSAREPLFEGGLVRDGAVVVAVGSHEPDAREIDTDLMRRAGTVVVEAPAAALREAGDVIQAVAEGALDPATLVGLHTLVRGQGAIGPGPRVFKSVGMSWEDVVVAAAAWERSRA